YYRSAVGTILVYDICTRSTFESIRQWLKEVRDYADDKIAIMLIGNKLDSQTLRTVSTDEGKKFADKNGCLFFETSALDTSNVEQAFASLLAVIEEKAESKNLIIQMKEAHNSKCSII
ncbi:unnamed protein product, partial [Didymodactylos carnosus]